VARAEIRIVTAEAWRNYMADSVSPAPLPIRFPLIATVLALAIFGAYARTLTAPFIFDDIPAIVQNEKIRHLAALGDVLLPGSLQGASAGSRPLVNLSLALNYALSGERVWSYHLFNVLIHFGASLLIFGLAERTLRRPILRDRYGAIARPLAGVLALLWALHPLQTETVAVVVQRTESLMSLFYLLTLYAFVRSVEEPDIRRWPAIAWLACALGMITKEVMVSAPLVVFLYDRTFCSGSFREAWRERRTFYVLLVLTWIPLGLLVLTSNGRGGTVGLGHGVGMGEYALTQCQALALYLKLALWPHPLTLDYGTGIVRTSAEVWPQMLLVLALLLGTVVALRRRPVLGFLGAWFFLILAPSSSVVPIVTQTMAEHRMYLPLAAVLALVAGTVHVLPGWRGFALLGILAAVYGVVTWERTGDYRSAEAIWRDTIAKRPANERAHYGLAMICDEQGRIAEAIGHYETALKLKPDYANAHSNLAHDLVASGRMEEAEPHYEEMARLQPDLADPHIHLGALLVRLGRLDDAVREYQIVLRLLPSSGEDHFNLAQVYFKLGRLPEAISHYEEAVRLKPGVAEMHFRLGNARLKAEQVEAALADYREAIRLDPDLYEAQMNLAGALVLLNRPGEAVGIYERALQLRPGDALTKENLERAKAQLSKAGPATP
jgi:tetratricopeptide (TPR) repeat protein